MIAYQTTFQFFMDKMFYTHWIEFLLMPQAKIQTHIISNSWEQTSKQKQKKTNLKKAELNDEQRNKRNDSQYVLEINSNYAGL